jgi:hypothetical protein
MKKLLYASSLLLMAMTLILSGCSVTKRHYAPGYHVEWHKSGANHLAKEEVSKDFKNGKEEELIVHSPEESKQVQIGFSPMEGQMETESMLTEHEGLDGAEDPSTERTVVENISENASDPFNQNTQIKTEDNSGSAEDKAAQAPPTDNNIFAILGLIFSILPSFWIFGVIFSIVGLVQIKKEGGEGKKLAVAGLIICGAWLLLFMLYFIVYAVLISQAIA